MQPSSEYDPAIQSGSYSYNAVTNQPLLAMSIFMKPSIKHDQRYRDDGMSHDLGFQQRHGSGQVLPTVPGIRYSDFEIFSPHLGEKKNRVSLDIRSAITFAAYLIACSCNMELSSSSVTDALTAEIRKSINALPPAHQIAPTDGEIVDNPQDG